jgi:hypothetical protein
LSSPEHQEKLKSEAKALREKVQAVLRVTDPRARMVRTIGVYAGMIIESLVEYEEPDVVMEQAFHRIAELLKCDPIFRDARAGYATPAWDIDRDMEIGRQAARTTAARLPKGMDDVHEIAIGMIINDFPAWEKEFMPREQLMRILIDDVVAGMTFEMATQDFCDMMIEHFIGDDGRQLSAAVISLAALCGYAASQCEGDVTKDLFPALDDVMQREAFRHGLSGPRRWASLSPSNEGAGPDISENMSKLWPQVDEFFELIGMDDLAGRAVALAKATGRMVAVSAAEDVGQINVSIAKSLAKTGMILGSQYKGEKT